MIRYELMRAEHVAAVAELERICFSAPWSEAAIASELDNPLSLWIVALEEDALAGYIGSQTVMDEADMMNLAVYPQFRGHGTGCGLVDALVSALKEKHVRSLTLEVRCSNEPAKALYAKMGFLQVGRRPNYYRAPKEDALILRKELAE